MAKIPSRKFPKKSAKIPSRKFPKSKTKIPSKESAKGTAKIQSQKMSKAPAAASEKPVTPVLPDRPTHKEARQDSLTNLKGNLKSLTPGSNLRTRTASIGDVPSNDLQVLASQNAAFKCLHSNLFADLPHHLPNEIVTTLLEAANVRIERIVSHGHSSAEGFWYDQDQHEWIIVLQGAATLWIEGDEQPIQMEPGDFLNIPAHTRHRVEWTTQDKATVWLAVHYGVDG